VVWLMALCRNPIRFRSCLSIENVDNWWRLKTTGFFNINLHIIIAVTQLGSMPAQCDDSRQDEWTWPRATQIGQLPGVWNTHTDRKMSDPERNGPPLRRKKRGSSHDRKEKTDKWPQTPHVFGEVQITGRPTSWKPFMKTSEPITELLTAWQDSKSGRKVPPTAI